LNLCAEFLEHALPRKSITIRTPIALISPAIGTSAKIRRTVYEPLQAANNNRIKRLKCSIIW